jgi:hypothetical protein
MAKQTIDLGTLGGADGTGDSIRTAGAKINNNFTELYATSAVQSHIGMSQNEITSTQSNADIVLKPSGTGSISFPAIKFNDNNIETTRTNDDLKFVPSGAGSFVVNSFKFKDNVISTFQTNTDIELRPSGSGGVDAKAITVDNSINMSDDTIRILSDASTNSDLKLIASGTGSVQSSLVDINNGAIDGTTIGVNTPAAATFSTIEFSPVDGGTLNADGVVIYDNKITTTSNADLEIEASGSGYVTINGITLPHLDGNTGQVLRTDGSGQLDWFTSPILLGVSDIQDNQTTISFAGQTVIDHVTAVGDHHRVESGTSVLDSFVTSKYDSAWYLAVNRDDNSTEFEVIKHSLCHGVTSDGSTTDAFVSSSASAQTGTNNHIITSADINDGRARLLGTGSSTFNSMAYYRIGLGDDDSTGYSGEEETAVRINTDVDNGAEVIDSWATASYRGAKYYISVKNSDSGEVSNLEAAVVHNGTDAFISVYNIIHSGASELLPTITATINGANVEVSATGANNNNRVHMYRILLSDNEVDRSSTNINVIGNVSVSSATTAIDTFDTGSYQAAHYIIVSHNASEGHSAICEAAVVSDGTNAFVTQYGLTSTKGTDQIILTVGHAGTTTTLSATSTSGGSTIVNAYRVSLTRGPGTATATATLDSVSATTYRGAKYNVQVVDSAGGNYECFEVNVVHDGSTAYTSTFGNVGNNIDLITVSADINAGNLRLRGAISNTNDHVVTVVRRVIEA